MGKPELAVGVPLYRPEERHLRECLSTIRQAGLEGLVTQVVLLDDSPNESSARIVEEVLQSDVPWSYSHNAERLGMAANWNAVVEGSDAEYVIVVGQDDVLVPESIRQTLRLLDRHPMPYVGHRRQLIIERSTRRQRFRRRFLPSRDGVLPEWPVMVDYALACYLVEVYGNVLGEPSSMVIQRRAWESVGGYSTDWSHAADVDFGLRVLRDVGEAALVPWQLAFRRIHSGALTSQNSRDGIILAERRRVRTDHLELSGMPSLEMKRRIGAAQTLYALWREPRTTKIAELSRGLGRQESKATAALDVFSLVRQIWLRQTDPEVAAAVRIEMP